MTNYDNANCSGAVRRLTRILGELGVKQDHLSAPYFVFF